jgi:hypothetical protein
LEEEDEYDCRRSRDNRYPARCLFPRGQNVDRDYVTEFLNFPQRLKSLFVAPSSPGENDTPQPQPPGDLARWASVFKPFRLWQYMLR